MKLIKNYLAKKEQDVVSIMTNMMASSIAAGLLWYVLRPVEEIQRFLPIILGYLILSLLLVLSFSTYIVLRAYKNHKEPLEAPMFESEGLMGVLKLKHLFWVRYGIGLVSNIAIIVWLVMEYGKIS